MEGITSVLESAPTNHESVHGVTRSDGLEVAHQNLPHFHAISFESTSF